MTPFLLDRDATPARHTPFFRRLPMSRLTLVRVLACCCLGGFTTACHGLLDVSNPTLVRESDIANASGANAKRLNALDYLNQTATNAAYDVAVITDEWTQDAPPTNFPNLLDKRDSQGFEAQSGTADQHLSTLDKVYYETSIAIPAVRAYTPDSLRGDFLGQLYAVRGYTVLQIAEDICPGFPLNDVTPDLQPAYSRPLTTDSAFAIASSWLDSAVKYAHDSVRFVALARVAKGRVLLDQGKFAEAATVVAPVTTDVSYDIIPSLNQLFNRMRPGSWSNGGFNFVVADRQGGNGEPFVTDNDARIPLVLGGQGASDPTITFYKTTKYLSRNDAFTLASGIEARLIEAEAALHAGDPQWLTILNTLRQTAISPALPDLVDPGSDDARVDLVYHERAYWLYLTGRRLGDLRRLITVYGRGAETVFPTGAYPLGGQYGTATSIPFIFAANATGNPYLTTGCTSR